MPAAERLSNLEMWSRELDLCYEGTADHPVFIALRETIQKNDIPQKPLKDLISAFSMDVVRKRYETFADLLEYCSCSANPVGRLVLCIFGYRDDALLQQSDKICSALQLANFWQDISVDRRNDRLYLPLEDLRRFSYTEAEWQDSAVNDQFRKLMAYQVNRTKEMFYEGSALISKVNEDLRLELKLVWFGGMAILRLIEKNGYDTHTRRPTIGTTGKMSVLMRGLFRNNLHRFGRRKASWDLTLS